MSDSGLDDFLHELQLRHQRVAGAARAIVKTAKAQGRKTLTPSESQIIRELQGLTARIAETKGEIKRSGVGNPLLQELKTGTTSRRGGAQFAQAINRARLVAPLSFGDEQVRALHNAIEAGESRRIEARAFNSVDSLLPEHLWPQVIAKQHDNRIIDRLPVYPTSLPSVSYIKHTGTTGVPAVTAEGAVKPELTFGTQEVIATVQKIAAHAGTSWEIISDWENFHSWIQTELLAQIVDVENNEILNGTGAGHITGFLATSGILTHTVDTVNDETALDALEVAITKLRVGSSLATADLLILNPATWSAIRRSKDAQDRYLTQPDPTVGEANSAWGVPVLVTTQIAAGEGVLLDTQKFGRVHVREVLNIRTGHSGDDLVRNIVRTVAEERLTLAVEHPSAVLAIDGLPTA